MNWQTVTINHAIKAMEHDGVSTAVSDYLKDKNSHTRHRLNSALFSAGIESVEDRNRLIVFFERSPKYGGGKNSKWYGGTGD